MLVNARSGQTLGFTFISAFSGTPLTGLSGLCSGYRMTDGGAQTALSGFIIEGAFGQYVAKLYDWDVSGRTISYFFTGASGAIPVEKTVVTTLNVSGQLYPASGINATVPPASLSGVWANSGLFVNVPIGIISGTTVVVIKETISGVVANSGLFVTANATVASGSLYLASGSIFRETYASGVLGASGGHTLAWGNSGQAWSASGANVVVPIASISGTNAVVPIATVSGINAVVPITTISGTNAVVPISTLSGVVANSGLTVTVIKETVSGVAATVFGSTLSGSLWLASGSLSGQIVDLLSGYTYPASGVFTVAAVSIASGSIYLASGTQVLVYSGQLSGQPMTLLSGYSYPASGVFTVATATVGSGTLYLASGSIFRETFASGVVGASGGFPTAWGNSGQVWIASGGNVVVPRDTLSGVVANSGLFVTATASVASGTLYLASGSIFRETYASGVLGASGGHTLAWGNSGQAYSASGASVVVPVASVSGVNAVVPITTISGTNAVVPLGTVSGVQIASGSLAILANAAHGGSGASLILGAANVDLPPLVVQNASGLAAHVHGLAGMQIHGVSDIGLYIQSEAGDALNIDGAQEGIHIVTAAAGRTGLLIQATGAGGVGMQVVGAGGGIQAFAGSGAHGMTLGGSGGTGVGLFLTGGSGVGMQGNIQGDVSGKVWPVSGFVWLASGVSTLTYSGQLSGQPIAGLSGLVFPASGVFTVVPKDTLSGVVANSGLFVTATATVGSGVLYLASGSIFRETFASGVVGASGGLPTSWGNSGQVLVPVATLSGVSVVVPLASVSGVNAVVPIATISGVNAVVPVSTLSGLNIASGQLVNVFSGQLSGQGVTALTVSDKSGYTLASGGLETVVAEAGINFRQAQSLILATQAGRVSGAGTATFRIAAADAPTTNRVLATVDASGNRIAITLSPPS